MPYCEREDLSFEFSDAELAVLTGDPTGNEINYERVDFAIVNASSTIDAYLWGVYGVPFEKEPIFPFIRKLAVDLTVVYLYEIAYKNGQVPNAVVWRRINAIKALKDLRDGKIEIEDLEKLISPPKSIQSNKIGAERLFDEEESDSFLGERI